MSHDLMLSLHTGEIPPSGTPRAEAARIARESELFRKRRWWQFWRPRYVYRLVTPEENWLKTEDANGYACYKNKVPIWFPRQSEDWGTVTSISLWGRPKLRPEWLHDILPDRIIKALARRNIPRERVLGYEPTADA